MPKRTYKVRLEKLEAAAPAEPTEVQVIYERRDRNGKPPARRLGPLYIVYPPGQTPKKPERKPNE